MATSTSLAVQSEERSAEDHMACLTVHFFTGTAKKLLPAHAALLIQNRCGFKESGCGPKFVSVLLQE